MALNLGLTIALITIYYNITKTISDTEAYLGNAKTDIADMRSIGFYSVESNEWPTGRQSGHGRAYQTGGA